MVHKNTLGLNVEKVAKKAKIAKFTTFFFYFALLAFNHCLTFW